MLEAGELRERGEFLVNHHTFRSAFKNLLRIGCITMSLSLTILDYTLKKKLK